MVGIKVGVYKKYLASYDTVEIVIKNLIYMINHVHVILKYIKHVKELGIQIINRL